MSGDWRPMKGGKGRGLMILFLWEKVGGGKEKEAGLVVWAGRKKNFHTGESLLTRMMERKDDSISENHSEAQQARGQAIGYLRVG